MDSEQTISITQIFGILRKRMRTIVITTLLVTLAAAFVTFFVMTPKYTATTELLVNRKLSADMQGAALQQTQADVQMISTYKDIITSPTVLQKVSKTVNIYPGYPGSINGLKNNISISSQQNSQVFSVTVKTSNARTSAVIANTTAKVFKKQVVKMMSVHNVSIVSKAMPNYNAVSPRKALNMVLGLLLGVVLGISFAFVRELSDKTVTTESFLTEDLGLTSLGVINEIDESEIKKRMSRHVIRPNTNNGDVLITDGIGDVEPRRHKRI
ncbi:chain-length determining protein [Levilactobacillus zymae]|uniref:Capsular polysaccharide biosynthesis protein CpsC n=1 Tax=Levilactobacillus zymae TaxID=267363 RepID=A0ABQ0WWY6_9LACO|nr:Wzz/FepE/Etk N-terminal domain-containing protein [Levilactobacillus zymae]KRL13153.1 capsular polysaccharide biosynthesis protein [Levilactobacillus zymae DSM 19395]QFR61167.1 chain-length determining protein [Levilactobacillus zymae]GEO72163.1 chain-length determining protein [Levilactobacillus zymae]